MPHLVSYLLRPSLVAGTDRSVRSMTAVGSYILLDAPGVLSAPVKLVVGSLGPALFLLLLLSLAI